MLNWYMFQLPKSNKLQNLWPSESTDEILILLLEVYYNYMQILFLYFCNGAFLSIVYLLSLYSLCIFSIQSCIFLQEYPEEVLVIDNILRMVPS